MNKDKVKDIYEDLLFNIFEIERSIDGDTDIISDVLIPRLSPNKNKLSAVILFASLFNIVVSLLEKNKKDITSNDVINFWSGTTTYEELLCLQKDIVEIYKNIRGIRVGREDFVANILLEYGFPIYKKYSVYSRNDIIEETLNKERKRIAKLGVEKKHEDFQRLIKYAFEMFENKKAHNPNYTVYMFAKNNWENVFKYAKENNITWNTEDKELSLRRAIYKKLRKK